MSGFNRSHINHNGHTTFSPSSFPIVPYFMQFPRRRDEYPEQLFARVHFRETSRSPQGTKTVSSLFHLRSLSVSLFLPVSYSLALLPAGRFGPFRFSLVLFSSGAQFGPSDLSRFFFRPPPTGSINARRLARGGALTKARVIR